MDKVKYTIWRDYANSYSLNNLKYLFGGICLSGVFANTNLDRNIQDWSQKSIRNNRTDQFSKVVKPIGEIYEPIGVYAAFTLLGGVMKHTTLGAAVHEWGSESLRAVIIGGPAVGILQYVLGASRPTEGSSGWHPFHDTNAVSGHAFMGAIPFLTASKMFEPVYLKAFFYLGSAATGLSRINNNKHYFSQALAGWWVAYLAVNALDEGQKRKIELCPTFFFEGWKMELCLSL